MWNICEETGGAFWRRGSNLLLRVCVCGAPRNSLSSECDDKFFTYIYTRMLLIFFFVARTRSYANIKSIKMFLLVANEFYILHLLAYIYETCASASLNILSAHANIFAVRITCVLAPICVRCTQGLFLV